MAEPVPSGGATVARYQLHERLRAGTPRVYRATDTSLGRDVRLKLYLCPPEKAAALMADLVTAHRAALELRHPAILPAYEVGHDGEFVYVAGSFAPDRTLAEALADGPFGERRAAVIARALAEGLAHAHERGFVHGDVHTSSVVLDADGGALWPDFGTGATAPPGNPAYAAPERLGDPPGPADTASDQYGIGVLLFELLAGRPPYEGADEEVVEQVLMAEQAPPL